MISEFPLLRLPYVPLSHILNEVDLPEIIIFSFISKRFYRLVKFCCKYLADCEIRIHIGSHFSIGTECCGLFFKVVENTESRQISQGEKEIKVNGTVVTCSMAQYDVLETYWKEPMVGMGTLLDYFLTLFDSPDYIRNLNMGPLSVPLPMIIDMMNSRKKSIKSCFWEWRTVVISDDDMTLLFNQKQIENLHLYVKPSEKFAYNEPFHWKSMTIHQGHWVTLPNLFGMSCVSIDVENSKFTNLDMNMFLKFWKNGGCRQLKFMYIQLPLMDIAEVLDGVEALEVHEDVERTYKYSEQEDQIIFGGYDVQNIHGEMGTLIHDGEPHTVNDFFYFVTWPDYGNKAYYLEE